MSEGGHAADIAEYTGRSSFFVGLSCSVVAYVVCFLCQKEPLVFWRWSITC